MNRIVWVQDLSPMDYDGGAQLTDRGHLAEGLRRGHDIVILTPQNQDKLLLSKDDFLIVSNCSNFPPERFLKLPNRYVVFHHDMFFRCFVPGSFVYVDGVPQPIENMVPGSMVLGESGHTQVKAVMNRRYDGQLYKIKPRGLPAVETTPEHPILIVPGEVIRQKHRQASYLKYNRKRDGFSGLGHKGQESRIITESQLEVGPSLSVFREARDLRVGDYVILPRIKEEEDYRITFGGWGRKFYVSDLDKEFAEVLGWYVAEGSATLPNGQVRFSFNIDEREYADRVAEILYRKFGLHYRFEFKPEWKSLVLVLDCRPFARWLLNNFGQGARNKCLPSWLMKAREGVLKPFLESYALGDGWHDRKRHKVVVTTASKRLAYCLVLLYAKLGLLATFHQEGSKAFTIRGKTYHNKGNYSLHISTSNKSIVTDSCIMTPIKRIETLDYHGQVYDLETDGGVFAAPIVTHNCKWRLFFPWTEKCTKDCPQGPVWEPVLKKALLHVFLSPLHYQVNREYFGESVEPHILVPSVINPDEFFDYNEPGRKGTCSVNTLLPYKGRATIIEYAKNHPEEHITIAGASEGQDPLPTNIEFIGPIAEGQVCKFFNKFETYLELPNTPQPFNRLAAEAFLSGCRIRGNALLGALSWPWFHEGRKVVAQKLRQAPTDFWQAIEAIV